MNVGPLGSSALTKTVLPLLISFLGPFVGMAPELMTHPFEKSQKSLRTIMVSGGEAIKRYVSPVDR